jgi:hypothetical protein
VDNKAKTIYNGCVETEFQHTSTQKSSPMGVLKVSWRREVLKKFNTVEG